MTDPVERALALWGLEDAEWDFVAARENRVYRVRSDRGAFALRLRRPGYRGEDELRSELRWMEAMRHAGLTVPEPLPSAGGELLEDVEGSWADMVGWLEGAPLGRTGAPLELDVRAGVFRRLGREIARLHDACDAWAPPAGFVRPHWDAAGLVGEAPLWGRFWENAALAPDARRLLGRFRDRAARDLAGSTFDYGLIHADLVRENVMLAGDAIGMIDFDDGGFGYRLFDVATALLKNRLEPDYPELRDALLDGYRTHRPLDEAQLPLFMALRATTYVGWIASRMSEANADGREARFIQAATELCSAYLADARSA